MLPENEFKKLNTSDSTLVTGQNYFVNVGSQNFLIFEPIDKILTNFFGLPSTTAERESKVLSNEKIDPSFTTNHGLSSTLVWMNNSRIRLEFKRSCLKQGKVAFTTNNVSKVICCLWIR